jgi:uncharacterized protein (DUF2147 family)
MRLKRLGRWMLGLAFGLVAALPAMASPIGVWEIESRDSRYDVTFCGDGTQLCAELIWLGRGADNAKNLPYLNTLLIDRASQSRPGQWRGKLHLFGQMADGTISQVSADQITLRGCVAFIVCKTYQMYRYSE